MKEAKKKTRKKSRVPKGWIIKLLRDISYKRPEYGDAKNRAKVDVGTYRCELCQCLMYEGTSPKRYEEFVAKYGNIKKEKPQLDHKEPVVDPVIGWISFDSYIERLFCDTEGLQVLCAECHDKKTIAENGDRKENKRGKSNN